MPVADESALAPRRRWLVRNGGDLPYVASWLVVPCLLIAAGAWRRGLDALLVGALGMAAFTIATTLAVARVAARWRVQALDARRRARGPHEPGAPPGAWISEATWLRAEGREPLESDLLDDLQPERSPIVIDPWIVSVTPADREHAPIVEPAAGAPVPPPGSHEALDVALRSSAATGFSLESPSWPVCCDRLATLVGTDHLGVDANLASALPAAHFIEADTCGAEDADARDRARAGAVQPYGEMLLADGVAAFHCRVCGRVYLGSFHP